MSCSKILETKDERDSIFRCLGIVLVSNRLDEIGSKEVIPYHLVAKDSKLEI